MAEREQEFRILEFNREQKCARMGGVAPTYSSGLGQARVHCAFGNFR